MKLFIKNSAGSTSLSKLNRLLEEMALYDSEVRSGELTLRQPLAPEHFNTLEKKLSEKGFTIIYDRKQIICEKVKHVIDQMINASEAPNENYSVYISKAMNLNYTYLANTFSDTECITIEHFIIQQKILKAQQLLQYNHTISEIADMLRYSNIAHFSSQFKRITGFTPSEYKKTQDKK